MSINEIKTRIKTKAIEVKYDVKCKLDNAAYWIENNKETAAALTTLAVTAMVEGGKMIRTANRSKQLKEEQKLKDLYVYDHSTGKYIRLDRAMRPTEIIEFSKRKANGEKTVDILIDMRLI